MEPEPAPTADSAQAPAAEAKPELSPAGDAKSASRRKAPSQSISRQRHLSVVRWEYVEVVFCDHGGFRPRYINGKQVRTWKRAPLIHDYLNHLGEQGWELAGVGGQHKNQMSAYLKRLRP
jgi:hypothetical protein